MLNNSTIIKKELEYSNYQTNFISELSLFGSFSASKCFSLYLSKTISNFADNLWKEIGSRGTFLFIKILRASTEIPANNRERMEQAIKRLYCSFARWFICSEKISVNSERITSKRMGE